MTAVKSDEQQSHNLYSLKDQQISFVSSWNLIYFMEEKLLLLVNELFSFWGSGAILGYGNKLYIGLIVYPNSTT